jgi:molecular chaperone HscB
VVERGYLELSQQHHPDARGRQTAAVQRAAMERSSRINAAYRVLRDPVLRAEYLIKLGGVDLDSSDPRTGAPHPTPGVPNRDDRAARAPLEEAGGGVREEIEARADAALDAAIAALDRGEVRGAAEQWSHAATFQRSSTR